MTTEKPKCPVCGNGKVTRQNQRVGPNWYMCQGGCYAEWDEDRRQESALEARVKELEGSASATQRLFWDEQNSLIRELALARAAAVQWVTYDGTPGTLPEQRTTVLLEREGRSVAADLVIQAEDGGDLDGGGTVRWNILLGIWHDGDMDWTTRNVHPGDRWAYLPTPEEEVK